MSRRLKRTNLFSKDVSSLLYAYGDVPQPMQSTVHCLDEIVAQYLVDVCSSASHVAVNSQRNKVKLEDFKFALRKDQVKLGRAEELIATNKVITEAKKQFNETDNSSLKRIRGRDQDDDESGIDEEDVDLQKVSNIETNTTKKSNGGKQKSRSGKSNKKQK